MELGLVLEAEYEPVSWKTEGCRPEKKRVDNCPPSFLPSSASKLR